METKVCSNCGIEKPLTEYHLRDKSKGIYRNICKECVKIYTKEYNKKTTEIRSQKAKIYRENNKEKIKEQKKKEYEKNRERYRESGKRRYRENAEEIKAKQREYNEKNKEKILERQKQYYYDNKDERISKQREYYKEHKEERQEYNKKYRQDNIEKLNEYQKQYYYDNKDRLNAISKEYSHTDKMRVWRREHKKERKANDPLYRLSEQTRTLINNWFRKQGYKKHSKTEKILGCEFDTFYNYLLTTYKNNYNEDWDGKEEVHIDHIIPISKATTKEEIIELCHYTNLQLLKAKDNLIKSNKLDWNLKN